MTVVVAVKISDGIVVASDSASSLFGQNQTILNIYNNANKIFNLRKGLPVGAMTSGAGSIGKLSTSTIAKDFRSELIGKPDPNDWTISEFSHRFF